MEPILKLLKRRETFRPNSDQPSSSSTRRLPNSHHRSSDKQTASLELTKSTQVGDTPKMSDKPGVPAVTAHSNPIYNQRIPMPGATFAQVNNQGLNFTASGALGNMSTLKGSLPSPITADLPPHGGRVNPLMVLPSGQTVPVSAFYPSGQTNADHISYPPTGVYPSFVGNQSVTTGGVGNYNWSYGVPSGITDLEPTQRLSWARYDENGPVPSVTPNMHQELLSGYQMPPANMTNDQTYIAGPIQPMKTKDNKGYEMVNIDELVGREPAMPHAVPALWTNQDDLSLAKCLQNPEGITNIYIRGFMPDTTDEELHSWASRFGEIESCKAILDQETGKCKGFGFVLYYSPAAAENCIRGFFHLGFQASYAQKSRNARLKDLEDKASTNIYCTGVPMDWNEADLAKHFLPHRAVSTKICRDSPSGVSKEVGFARFEAREIAERVIRDFHSVTNEDDRTKLFLRFADTKAQKQLKLQSQERRNWRSREYTYSVEHTPSPTLTRFQNVTNGISPTESYQSPADAANNNFTPATSVSPPEAQFAKQVSKAGATRVQNAAWPMQGSLQTITNGSTVRRHVKTPSPKKGSVKTETILHEDNVGTEELESTK